jgi:hypothetical protein
MTEWIYIGGRQNFIPDAKAGTYEVQLYSGEICKPVKHLRDLFGIPSEGELLTPNHVRGYRMVNGSNHSDLDWLEEQINTHLKMEFYQTSSFGFETVLRLIKYRKEAHL